MTHRTVFSTGDGWRYGLLGLPLAFCALPLYVLLPNLYARNFGVPLTALGLLLLGARLLDAAIDPLLGRLCDRLYARSLAAVLAACAGAAMLLAFGFALLFLPPEMPIDSLLLRTAVLLVLTYSAYSLIMVAHQSWGAMLGGDETQRSRIVFWREGFGLLGVVLAAATPALLGLPAMLVLLALTLAAGWLAWSRTLRPLAARPTEALAVKQPRPSLWRPWRVSAFRRLLAVFMCNGIASAVPATLVLFFVQDRLQAPAALEPAFLGLYFVCAALSMPLWLQAVKRWGLGRSWLFGIGLAISVFLWASQLGSGDSAAFLLVCALSGVALGSDLALPGAMLAGIIADAGDRGRAEGAYFGWWNFATKLNLALAAGLALPLLGLFGYAPGVQDPAPLRALTVAYCLLPCALKAGAAVLLYTLILQPGKKVSLT